MKNLLAILAVLAGVSVGLSVWFDFTDLLISTVGYTVLVLVTLALIGFTTFWVMKTIRQTAVQQATPLFGPLPNFGIIIFGTVASAVVAIVFYNLIAYPAVFAAFESHIAAKVIALFCSIALLFEMGVRKHTATKPEHEGLVKFFGNYIAKTVPAGDSWLPPFCERTEINVGEQTIDMRDTEVYVEKERKATLHLQAQMRVVNSYAYGKALASMTKFDSGSTHDAVIQSTIGKIKAAVRLYCEKIPNLENLVEQKEDIIKKVTDDATLNSEVEKWGVKITGLIIRTVILPKELSDAANAVEIEQRQREAETKDAQTLVKLGSIIRNGYVEIETNPDGSPKADSKPKRIRGFGQNISPEKLLTATQVQQKRVQGISMGGRGMAIINDKQDK